MGEVVYLATHGGLHRLQSGHDVLVGPDIDLMGFAVAGPDHFYASGHPGAGSSMPDPVGLIESIDGGRTWTPRSLGGQVDFHVLAVAGRTIVGFAAGCAFLETAGRLGSNSQLQRFGRLRWRRAAK